MPRLGKHWLALVAAILTGIVGSEGRAQAPPPNPGPPSPSPPASESDDLAAKLAPPALQPTDRPLPINLATALRLSADRPLVVAAAQASAMVAQAQLERARVLWIPTLNIGFDYYRHDGGIQDLTNGQLNTVSSNFLYAGGGSTLIVAAS